MDQYQKPLKNQYLLNLNFKEIKINQTKEYKSLEDWASQAQNLGYQVTKNNKNGSYYAWAKTKFSGQFLTGHNRNRGILYI
jgi:surface antigen